MRLACNPQWLVHCRRTWRRLLDEHLVDLLADMAWNG